MHGVKRVLLFCFMTAILPAMLIIIPLYLRHYVFADVTVPVAESDVLAIREGYSSIFCDALKLKMNSSFNAFQLVGTPIVSHKRRHIRLKKSMSLPDDTLEYWGFYLLKEATVRLKVCSRYEGARILVVRGGKNLNTCGLMDHNYEAYGAKMDSEYREVKVFDEEPADFLGELDMNVDWDNAVEDTNDDDVDSLGLELRGGKEKILQRMNGTHNEQKRNQTEGRHHKRHSKRWQRKVRELKQSLDGTRNWPKRIISPLDSHIKHGGNAMNFTDINVESESVSSFETDLLRCYDSRILLSRGFVPSRFCNTTDYLDKSNHMVTEHTAISDGYYYYIFYSDNDFVKNDIHAVFNIYKPTYRFANTSSGNECINQTECEFPIHLMSDETVIVEVPTRDGIEHEEDDITLLTSTCKPRMGVYMIFPILVLLSILICAFL
ncbi:hypothetical protein JTB14_031345 [Gonioctena quinquepunctata]|nr:hypothetical protein JTB14_031345 [Gonioctena quinquepunctata]